MDDQLVVEFLGTDYEARGPEGTQPNHGAYLAIGADINLGQPEQRRLRRWRCSGLAHMLRDAAFERGSAGQDSQRLECGTSFHAGQSIVCNQARRCTIRDGRRWPEPTMTTEKASRPRLWTTIRPVASTRFPSQHRTPAMA